ncbi:MAG TPA: ribosome biogenesis factor YjgA [Burkholderiaceae bacterium]|nr:ribosome biogenesis factor YjgA [Burkholderiaceae bacterium]
MITNDMEATPDDAERPSKTELKREMHALQTLGEQLVELSNDQLARLDLPEELREAVEFAHRVKGHEARRRHMQYLGKLMRRADADAIRMGVKRVTGESRAAVSLMHQAETWRDRLLDDDNALTAFIAEHPDAETQWFRSAIRSARRERTMQQPPKHARELYRRLHLHLESRQLQNESSDNGPLPDEG